MWFEFWPSKAQIFKQKLAGEISTINLWAKNGASWHAKTQVGKMNKKKLHNNTHLANAVGNQKNN